MAIPTPTSQMQLDDGPAVVVASVDATPVDADEETYLVLLLSPRIPHYVVAEVTGESIVVIDRHPNIVPAVESYQDNGGDR